MRNKLACLVIAVATVFAAACAGPADLDDVVRAQARWRGRDQLGRLDYVFTWQEGCACGPEVREPIEITVGSQRVLSAVYAGDRRPVPPELRRGLMTIDQVFDEIRWAFDHGVAEIAVDFDSTWSYPSFLFIDYSSGVADEEFSLLLSRFAPVSR